MNISRWLAVSLVWAAGLATIIGSSVTEEGPPPPEPVPVTVQFDLTNDFELRRELETRTAFLSDLILSGTYDGANQGEKLTLDRNSITLNAGGGFTLKIEANDPELLIGENVVVEVTEALDVGLSHDPVDGRFNVLFAGTTTDVIVTASGVDVFVGGSTTPNQYNWANFEAVEDDADVALLDLRMASAAYNMFEVVLRATRQTEDIIDDIETNKSTLEEMNVNSGLSLTCDNTVTDGGRILRWRLDSPGNGQDLIGDGDNFDVDYTNCSDNNRGHFLDGVVELSDYNPTDTVILSTLGIKADFVRLYLSDTAIDGDTVPGANSPRLNGDLTIRYEERPAPVVALR